MVARLQTRKPELKLESEMVQILNRTLSKSVPVCWPDGRKAAARYLLVTLLSFPDLLLQLVPLVQQDVHVLHGGLSQGRQVSNQAAEELARLLHGLHLTRGQNECCDKPTSTNWVIFI